MSQYKSTNTTTINRVNKDKNFTTINNICLRDKRLSWKAKGIMAYILTLPDWWVININEVIKHSPDGEKGFRSGLKELKECGYVVRVQIRDEKRIVGWHTEVNEIPENFDERNQVKFDVELDAQKLHVEKVDVEKLHVEKEVLINTKDINNLKEINTKDIKDKSAKPPSASKVKYEEDNHYYLLAKFFASQMESVNERDKVKDLQKAANDFRLLYERDGKEKNIQDLTEIKNVIIATYKNEFWKDKVRSSDKFRKQYGALYNEMKKKFPNMIKQQEIKKEPIQPAYTPLQADENGFDGTNLSYEFMNRGIDNDTLIAYYKKQVEITGKGVFDGKREIPLKEWIEDFQMFNK